MPADPDLVRSHYAADTEALLARVRAAIAAMGPGPLPPGRLAGLDQFHLRGLEATAELGALLGLAAEDRVLDAGSGLGGPARLLASEVGCRVSGIDLSPGFVAVAQLLAERTGLAERVDFAVGDLCALDLPAGGFDVAYTQHVVMNIHDRAAAYAELRRVLRPGGRFGFYDLLAAPGGPPHFPLPWASDPAASHLLTEEETRAALAAAGFAPLAWQDQTELALRWFAAQRAAPPPPGPTLGIAMGPGFAAMAANLARSLAEGRLRLVMASWHAA